MTSNQLVGGADSQSASNEGTARRISKDNAYHLLQNSRRRAVLRYLCAHDDTEVFDMRAIAEEVAAWEHDTTVSQLHSDQRQRIYVSLFQSHLPKLSTHGAIEYEQSRGIVRPGPLLPVLEPCLADCLHTDDERLTVAAESCEATTDSGIIRSVGSLLPR